MVFPRRAQVCPCLAPQKPGRYGSLVPSTLHSRNTAAPDGQKGAEHHGPPAVIRTEHTIRAQFLFRQPALHQRHQPLLCPRPPPRLQGRRAFKLYDRPSRSATGPRRSPAGPPVEPEFPAVRKTCNPIPKPPEPGPDTSASPLHAPLTGSPGPSYPAVALLPLPHLPRLAKASRATPWHCRVTPRVWNPLCRSSVSTTGARKIPMFLFPGTRRQANPPL